MEDFLFLGADFSDFDHSGTRRVGGSKDALLRAGLRSGYVHRDGDEHERSRVRHSRVHKRDGRSGYNDSSSSAIEPDWC
jgi:hypothetical protein